MAQRTKVGDKPKSESGGDPNVMSIKDSARFRIVDDDQLFYRQHAIEHQDDDDQVEFVVCPGPEKCPLCRKPADKEGNQRFPMSKRYATNVWDYEKGAVKVLIAGPQVFDEFQATKDVGLDPTGCDWNVHKMGSGKSTKYKMVRGDASTFKHADEVTPDALHDLDKYGMESTPEKIFELLEEAGWDYDALEMPEFTLEEAEGFVLPFGRMKGNTIEQALAQDQEWCEWLHGAKLEQGSLGDPVFVALQTVMEHRNLVGEVADLPEPSSTPSPDASDEQDPASADPAPESGTVKLKSPDGSEVEVPQDAAPSLEAAGFTRVDEPAEAPSTPPKVPIYGNQATAVKVGGAGVTMTFGAAVQALKGGAEVSFDDPEIDAYANMLVSTGGDPVDADDAPAQTKAEAEMHEEGQEPKAEPPPSDKPFSCQVEGCDWTGKTKGALTQHINKAHSGEGAASNGGDQDEETLERVKGLLEKLAVDSSDYQSLLDLFQEVANKRNISDFTNEELEKLADKLEEKINA